MEVEGIENIKLYASGFDDGYEKASKEAKKKLDKLINLCFDREAQLSNKIKGYDYHNGYSCALHDIRGELKAIKESLNDAKCVLPVGGNE